MCGACTSKLTAGCSGVGFKPCRCDSYGHDKVVLLLLLPLTCNLKCKCIAKHVPFEIPAVTSLHSYIVCLCFVLYGARVWSCTTVRHRTYVVPAGNRKLAIYLQAQVRDVSLLTQHM